MSASPKQKVRNTLSAHEPLKCPKCGATDGCVSCGRSSMGRKVRQIRGKASPLNIALPLQNIETINESSQERQRSLERFVSGREIREWRNRLIWGDKKYVLPSLVPEFANSFDLIYIDLPFDTGEDFSHEVPGHETDRVEYYGSEPRDII